HVDDVVRVNLHFAETPVSGIYNVGSGKAQSFNDVALAVVNTMRENARMPRLGLESAVSEGLIEYVPFPTKLLNKYQAFTQADLARLRSTNCGIDFRSVELGTAEYVHWRLRNAE
ncbi:MAG TPA: ADP-L-glycero-D-mannoheptose-6-epimerase, partial [Burkholderiaceae bacterium]|nr:ADP-L-glycero-D-mannoheptose-6-epimerase [Burkholderiaceae bacterium]